MALKLDSIQKKKKQFVSNSRSSTEKIVTSKKEVSKKRIPRKVKPWSEELVEENKNHTFDKHINMTKESISNDGSIKTKITDNISFEFKKNDIENKNSTSKPNKSKFKFLIPRIFYQYTK